MMALLWVHRHFFRKNGIDSDIGEDREEAS